MASATQPSKVKPLLIAIGVIAAIVFVIVSAPNFVRSLGG